MGEVVGEGGRVVGVDKNIDHLRHLSGPPFEVVADDLLEVPLDSAFDLAHCRYVLIHNRTSDEMLRELGSNLKRGGFLVVEEPDFTSAKLLNHDAGAAEQQVSNAICWLFEDMGLNPAYGLTLRSFSCSWSRTRRGNNFTKREISIFFEVFRGWITD